MGQWFVTDEGRRLEPPEKVPVAVCNECKGEIYNGEIYGKDDSGHAICRDCIDEEWSRLADDEKFEILGYELII